MAVFSFVDVAQLQYTEEQLEHFFEMSWHRIFSGLWAEDIPSPHRLCPLSPESCKVTANTASAKKPYTKPVLKFHAVYIAFAAWT